MAIKAIALDMDGTLLDENNHIHENLVFTLKKINQKGVKIFLATGRTQHEIEEVLPVDFPYDGAVTSNGMGCYTRKRQILQYKLDPDLVEQVIRLAREHQVYYEIHSLTDNRYALERDRKMMQQELNKPVPKTLQQNELYSRKEALHSSIAWKNRLNTKDVVKIYFFSTDCKKIESWKRTLSNIKLNYRFSTSSSTEHNVEIMNENVSKATTLKVLLNEFGLSSYELMAIGDGENDLPMFNMCSHSVAMKNAPELVKEKADEITKYPYDNYGLYSFLREKIEQGMFGNDH